MQDATLYEKVLIVFGAFSLAIAVSAFAYFKGYFRKLFPIRPINLAFTDVISVLLMLLLVRLLIAPATFVVLYTLFTGNALNQNAFASDPSLQGYFSIIMVSQLLICYGFYLYFIRPQLRPIVYGASQNPIYDISIGIVSWLIAFPWVAAFSQLVEAITHYFVQEAPIEQEAVQFMRSLKDHPYLLVFSTLLVAVVVPIIEEIVFRGFLQQWLKRFMNPYFAITATGFAFALAHFSTIQGLSNLPIITALFILALFLGYLRERQGNLLAPIALHATVNTVTLTIILIQELFHENPKTAFSVLFSIWGSIR